MPYHGPEYYLKEAIKEHLATLHRDGAVMEMPKPYTYMPVPYGYGKKTVDFFKQKKRPVKKRPTKRKV